MVLGNMRRLTDKFVDQWLVKSKICPLIIVQNISGLSNEKNLPENAS
jgi:hypothetical protein